MLLNYIHLLRPKHWIKNIFVFAALIFSLNLFNIIKLAASLQAFFAFCLTSSFVYIINDIIDIEQDRKHPKKRNRPIPSGKISIKNATTISIVCLITSITLAYFVNLNTLIVILVYIFVNIFYSIKIKNVVILDVMFIALGFILRMIAGATAIGVSFSNWILLTTFCISLFLGFGKRRGEILLTNNNTQNNARFVLKLYSMQFLDYMIMSSVTLTIISYALYTIDSKVIKRFGTDKLIYTVPLVIYGIFRYLYVIYRNDSDGDPTEVVLKDKSIISVVLLWILLVIGLIYGVKLI
ncbi:decaprenyl-phosphate phosphoribosyltransferase [bacterium]|nr:decaprenyl-phosphate phosphoribosyltransferase [bacterium]MBU4510119.1 decaprenyl-phosphate phosphoribosyltransferase [bacterium]